MSEESRGNAPEPLDEPEVRARRRSAGLGRRVVLAVWAVAIIYVTIVAFSSIVPQAFFPEYAQAEHRQPPSRCEPELRALYDDLMEHASAETRDPTDDPDREAAFFRDWDRRHQSLTGQCDEQVHATLGRLRHRIQTSLRRYEREEGRMARSLARRLASHDAPSASTYDENHP